MSKSFKNKAKNPELAKAIDIAGGVVELSKLLGVPHSSVSRWLNTDMPTPIKHAIKIEKLTKGKVKAKDLRPDVFI
jgi:DNA-binding transcriptional regulator YdaS (Cro superfamily)